jgi:Highly conserved protein containing a thioredoxin domain
MANRLIDEASPYLLQHAHNPVDWYPWGDEAFAKAKEENKPVLVSIGYAACHWCHVMERESFEDEATAAYMNKYFINIKVDREERPDVDHLYMDAVQAISGSGGWPLNAFVTPDRVPFYGGTYFPPRPAYSRPSWMQLLQRMQQLWQQQKNEVDAQATQMLQYLQNASKAAFGKAVNAWDKETCKTMAANLLQQADTEHGGFGRAPKFPGTMSISFLLEHYHFTGDEAAIKHALLSLDAMSAGGINDQLAGGFARYSTDDVWLAPHFEKMLYDNALLILSLCDAYSITKEERYKHTIEHTIAFVEEELAAPNGIFYSALDADSEGEEGKYYTWTWEEWQQHAGDDNGIAAAYFGVTEEGNWEHTNILHIAGDVAEIAQEKGVSMNDAAKYIIAVEDRLKAVRSKRIRPLIDDKSLLAWNALMNLALCKAGNVLQSETYRDRAVSHMQEMLANFDTTNGLMHVWKNGKATVPANLDDYAYLVQAMIQLSSATGEESLLQQAERLTDVVMKEFAHDDGSFFYFSAASAQDIPVRKVDIYDGALPSANAVMAHNLLLLGMCMERTVFSEHAQHMLAKALDTTVRYTYSFAYWAMLHQRYAEGIKTAAIAGPDRMQQLQGLLMSYIPQCLPLTSKKEISELPLLKDKKFQNQTHIFVCTDTACMPAVADVEAALELIRC